MFFYVFLYHYVPFFNFIEIRKIKILINIFFKIFFKYFFVMNYGNKKTNSKKMKKKFNFQKYFIEL